MPSTRGCVGILFVLSLIAGVSLGFLVVDPSIRATPTIPPPNEQVILPTSRPSITLLVLGVDSLQRPDSGLEGVWAITTPQDPEQNNKNLHFHIETLYPITELNPNLQELSQYLSPHPKIVINPDDPFNEEKLSEIGIKISEWPDAIILDEYIINMIILILKNPNIDRPIPPPPEDLFTKTWENPSEALKQQRGILITLCDHPEPLKQFSIITEILQFESAHFKTVTGKNELIGYWQAFNNLDGNNVSCDIFP